MTEQAGDFAAEPSPAPAPMPSQAPMPLPLPSQESTPAAAAVLTPEQLAERQQRANRATRGGLAALLCLEAFVVLLVPRAIAQTSTGLSGLSTSLLLVFAVVLVTAGFLLRRPWGIGLGSGLQLVLGLTIFLVPLLAIVVIFFVALWVYLLQTRHQIVGTPAGWRMLVS